MKVKILVILSTILLNIHFPLYGNNNQINHNPNNENKIQVGIYFGNSLTANISRTHGLHKYNGRLVDMSVEGVELKQNYCLGVNAKYYFIKELGLEFDMYYTEAEFPEQRINLESRNIYQPESDLNYYSISVGPIYRYKNKGMWNALNPYVSLSFSYLFGDASNADYYADETTSYSGSGFSMHLGLQYTINKIVLLTEYRYEYINSELEEFRSFEDGIDFTKKSSYIIFGISYTI